MSKNNEALKQKQQPGAAGNLDALNDLSVRLAAGHDMLSDALDDCRNQLAELTTQIADESELLSSRLKAFDDGLASAASQSDSANQRIDRTAESFASAVGSLHARIDQVDQRLDATLRTAQEQIGQLHQRVETTLGDWNRRVEELVDEVRALIEGTIPALDELRSAVGPVEHLAQSVEALQKHQAVKSGELSSLREEVDALATEKAALREVVAAQARQIAEAIQLHRSTLGAAIEAQIEPLRTSLKESNARLEAQISKLAASERPPADPPSTFRFVHNRNRGALPPAPPPARSQPRVTLTSRRSVNPWRRRGIAAAVLGSLALLGLFVAPRLSSTTKSMSRSDATAQSLAGLQDPTLADRFAGGVKALQQGDFGAAERAFRDVVAARPSCVEARNNLAVALDEQRRREAAIEQLREALRLQPDYDRAKANLRRLQNGE